MMQRLERTMNTLSSTSSELAREVHEKAQLRVDADKVAAAVADRTLTEYDKRVEAALRAQEVRMASVGEVQASRALEQLAEAVAASQSSERKLEALRQALTWGGVGNVALALLPFCLATLTVALGMWGAGAMLGVGPIFGWIWASFESADLWWTKLSIGLGGLTLASAVGWAVFKSGTWVADKYRGW
jgi:hypothetical protein